MRIPRRVVLASAGTIAVALIGLLLIGVGPTSRPAEAIPFLQIEAAHAEHQPVLDGTEPIYVLLIGSDARPGEAVDGVRADSIHVVSFNPATGRSAILGFPRDSWVPIPGYGTSKINGAMTQGGPELLVQTIEELTGITIDYWALTWFEGFIQVINDIGGLTFDVPFATSDPYYSRAEFQPGVQTLNGVQALAWARNRHGLPSGDFGRSENQGRLMVAALAQLKEQAGQDLGALLTYIGAGLRSTQSALPFDQILRLAFAAISVDPATIQNVVVPGYAAMEGETSIVRLDESAPTLYADMADDGIFEDANVPESPNASLLD